mmetsp:Transcript_13868/g.15638  ORF Transcript_13868/g.15638 Transcript_13868/m.15638 type:complete len:896 (-) Transcript_13868:106-2793(-)
MTVKLRKLIIMGASTSILLHPLTVSVLLALIPVSHSWGLFRKPPPPSSSTETTLAEATKDALEHNMSGSKGTTEPILINLPENMKGQSNSQHTSFFDYASIYTPTILSEALPVYLKNIFLYKPPVGLTSVYVLLNLLLSRNKKLVASLLLNEEQEQRQMDRSTKRREKRVGRSLELDESDGELDLGLGGVEAVRTELCLAVLSDFLIPTPTLPSSNSNENPNDQNNVSGETAMEQIDLNDLTNTKTLSYYALAAHDALRINAAPRSSREDYIERTIDPLVRLQHLTSLYPSYYGTKQGLRNTPNYSNKNDNNKNIDILLMASKVAEIRTIDAVLRTLRDRLVLSAVRLARKEKYRAWRLQWYETGLRYGKQIFRKVIKGKTVEDDRRNLQLTRAALKRELERLGQVQQLLLNRPCELSETRLLMASSVAVDDEFKDIQSGPTQQSKQSTGQINAAGARIALFYSDCDQSGYDNSRVGDANSTQDWRKDAHEWTMTSRAIISEFVTETISAVFPPSSRLIIDRPSTVGNDLDVLSKWSRCDNCGIEEWDTLLTLVDNLSKARLMREHKYLPTAIDLKYWLKKIDIYGIPSSLALIGISFIAHNTIKPFWSEIVEASKLVGETVWGVIEFRFVNPLKDITLDLLNRRPKLLDPFALSNEENSLDNMLRDLGIGDGTKKNRREALAAASRMYEKELAQGAIRNLFTGGMVRLLLIQVQQLKTGLLQAMGSIDDLMDANRLNVQLLATIPAVLLVTFGTRFFFTALYSLRSKGLVGLPSAHAEMSDILRKMERCLLLSSHAEDKIIDVALGNQERRNHEYAESPMHHLLNPNELGEFVLYMHSYLVILDYCSPPFPAKACNAIHAGMQDLLMQGQLTTKRQIALLQLINAKHSDLLKSI